MGIVKQKTVAELTYKAVGLDSLTKGSIGLTGINQGLELVSKGFDLVAKTARLADAAIRPIIQAGSSFEQFNLQFETLLGSADAATKRMEQLFNFASTTPFDVSSVVEAAKTMEAFGIFSEEALTRIGDASAAFGKDLVETTLAVAGAATGELERLKQFGITSARLAKQLGHEVRRDTVQDLKDIANATLEIFEETAGGGMERLKESLEGIVNEIGDSWLKFQLIISDTKAFDTVKGIFREVRDISGRLLEGGDAQAVGEIVGNAIATALKAAVIFMGQATIALIKAVDFLVGNFSEVGEATSKTAKAGLVGVITGIFAGVLTAVVTKNPRAALAAAEVGGLGGGALAALLAGRRAVGELRGGGVAPLAPPGAAEIGRQQAAAVSALFAGEPIPVLPVTPSGAQATTGAIAGAGGGLSPGAQTLIDLIQSIITQVQAPGFGAPLAPAEPFIGPLRPPSEVRGVGVLPSMSLGGEFDVFEEPLERRTQAQKDSDAEVVASARQAQNAIAGGWMQTFDMIIQSTTKLEKIQKLSFRSIRTAFGEGIRGMLVEYLRAESKKAAIEAAKHVAAAIGAVGWIFTTPASHLLAAAKFALIATGAAIGAGAVAAGGAAGDVFEDQRAAEAAAAEEGDGRTASGTRQLSRTTGITTQTLTFNINLNFMGAAVFGRDGIRELYGEHIEDMIQESLDLGRIVPRAA